MPQHNDTPSATSPIVDRMRPLIKTVRAVFGGTRVMQAAAKEYLPQHPAETRDAYDARLLGTVLYNAFARTVGGLTGLLFRKDLTFVEAPETLIEEQLEDVDLLGRSLNRFARDAARDVLVDGIGFILVDFPMSGKDKPKTLADERRQGLRPNFVFIRADQFVSARFVVKAGLPELSQFIYKETIEVPKGNFLTESVEQFRVLMVAEGRGFFEIWRHKQGASGSAKELEKVDEGRFDMPGTGDTVIAVTPIYAGRVGHFEAEPPLLDLAHENIAHWQLRSDHYYALHVSNVPVPIFIGRNIGEDDKLVFGPGMGIDIPEGGDAKYLEFSGNSLQHSREELRDIENRMAALGLAMLQRDTRAAETAQAKRIDKVAEDSALAEFASSLEHSLNEALAFNARWNNSEKGGTISVNREYLPEKMEAAEIREFRAMVAEGSLSIETLWELLEQSDSLPDGFDPELERERIETPMLPAPEPEPIISDDDEDDDDEDEDDDDSE